MAVVTLLSERIPLLACHLIELATENSLERLWLESDSDSDNELSPISLGSGSESTLMNRYLLEKGLSLFGEKRFLCSSRYTIQRLYSYYHNIYLSSNLGQLKDDQVYPVASLAKAYKKPINVTLLVMRLVLYLSCLENQVKFPHQSLWVDPLSYRCPDLVETLGEGVDIDEVRRIPMDTWVGWFSTRKLRYPRLTIGLLRHTSGMDLYQVGIESRTKGTPEPLLRDPLAVLTLFVGFGMERLSGSPTGLTEDS